MGRRMAHLLTMLTQAPRPWSQRRLDFLRLPRRYPLSVFFLYRVNDVLHVGSHCHLHQPRHRLHQEFELPRLRPLNILVARCSFMP